ncbi:hypothetical protein BCR36DRAFT_460495 [Piromyces finnis]|uniref:Reverse transcriptase RNase H-like domain-containing protein n=1 Tax=Piromyces finnis TaxID=1754191 RepID=A0A1Y1UYV0_9FUNG|nr:hypothetical protein BCR36DRAFT_460495 [Piromyces finnis]|eukprot:ORX43521.1 hypothetical protein BCR36DRAFT_460495 [Piromyces finnis]
MEIKNKNLTELKKYLKPIGFYSRKLNSTERKYSTFDRELLALSETLLHYRLLLQQGQKIYCATDHKNLVIYINSGSKVETNRKLRLFENIYTDFKVFKATINSLIQSNKQNELKEYLFKWYQNQNTLFESLKEQIEINKLKEEIHSIQTGKTQIETKRKLDKLNQKINDLRYDLNPKAERIELTKKVNTSEKQLESLWKTMEELKNKIENTNKRINALIIDNELKEIFPTSDTAISNELKKRKLSNFQIEIDLTKEQHGKTCE